MKTTTRSFTRSASLKSLTLAGFYLSLALSPAMAQSAAGQGDEAVYNLEDFVVVADSLYMDQVNALKTPTPIIDVPQSLSITTAEDISLRGFESIGDIVDYTPGVSNNQGEGHRDAVVFRGALTTADFFIDGVRDDVQYYRPLYNVEQVEILRGPNALLFGRGGSGGILNRVTKKATIGEDFNAYSISANTFGAAEAQIDKNFAVSKDVAFRLNAYLDTFENHRDFSDGDGMGLNPTLKYQLSEETSLDLSYEYVDYDRSIDRGIPTGADGEPIDALKDTVFGDQDLNKSEFEASIFRALLQHRFSDTLKGNFTASYGDYDKLYQNFYASNYVESTETATLSGYADGTKRTTTTLTGSLVGEFATGEVDHTVLAGVESIHTANDNFRTKANNSDVTLDELASFSGSFTNFGDLTEAEVDVVSLFIQDEIGLTDSLDLVLGLRYDRIDFAVDILDEKGDLTAKRSQVDEKITPRLGFVYKPEENVSLYASYSESFLPKSGGQYASVKDALDHVDPDEFTNLEAGVKWDFAQGYSVTTAVFQIDQKYAGDNGSGGTQFVDAEIGGFEAQFLGQVTDQWSVSAGYSYLTGEDSDGGRPAELPKNMFSVWNNYQLTKKLGLGLGAVYQDESTPKGGADGIVPSFVRFDAAAYYQLNENLRLQLNIENLLDEVYYPHAYGTHQATVGAPINARFAIVGRF
jgi:catecholate siderophore receptor